MSSLDGWLERPYIERNSSEQLWEFASESLHGEEPCDKSTCSEFDHCDDCVNRRCDELIEDQYDAEAEREIQAAEDRAMFPEDYR